ncbi:universal stress protein [Acidimicrobiia bacterium EGI L10123]|uniref:universal stress protein n=1 Tax=Salinilacustrithrix flava TaxID=2957203 RepID=UPI003D7C27B4|nr:universal stress protein [Acidimicrobiia bacterium EGI L10123]
MSYDTVVVGYDGSSDADRAVEVAADQVAPDGTVHVVTAFHPESTTRLMQQVKELPEEFRYTYDPAAAEKERQHPALERLRGRGTRCEGHIVADDPAAAIIDVSEREGATLVVVGSRGLGRVQRFLRGSVSARVAAHAPMSVLIVHDPSDT